MAQSIVTLGVGGTAQLTWFVTSGLHTGTDVEFAVAVYTVSLSANQTPAGNVIANFSPSVNLRSNPSPTEEVLSG